MHYTGFTPTKQGFFTMKKLFAAVIAMIFGGTPDPLPSQHDNRVKLADHLERNVTDDDYDHSRFDMCALGHAGKAGICGMKMEGRLPILASRNVKGGDPWMLRHTTEEDSETVFGVGTWNSIFDYYSPRTRMETVEKLRSFEPVAA